DGLYADGDSSFAAESARELARMARSTSSPKVRAAATCALDQRALLSGKRVDVAASRRVMLRGAETSKDSLNVQLCTLIVEALHADQTHSNALQAVTSLDDFLRRGPQADAMLRTVGNLVASQLFERLGDRNSAARAVKRRAFSPSGFHIGAAPLREEARLRAATGDNGGAIKVYKNYLDLHLRAEPSLKQQDDAARRDLARLTGEN
ncbi:MAG TPA: hypothetical protein VM100_08945, partial [Longimicrobiales bacterium]|nr:hypothetical protein [Longimicrobiales bacterium]